MTSTSVAVIGQGFVGGSLTTVLNERGIVVYTYDKSGKQARGGQHPRLSHGLSYPAESVRELVTTCESLVDFSRVYFVCLPTPMHEDGGADLSIVQSILEQLADVPGDRIAVVKSTVPPGSTDMWNKQFSKDGLHTVFNPEFLTEANALDDMRNQNRIVLGGPRPWINTVKQVFQTAFPKVPIVKTSSTNAELTKYVTNCFLAMKVSFANEMYQVCQALDAKGFNADYDRVIECATLDTRLGSSHWNVPGPDGHLGYGGSCFCKDVNALMFVSRQLGVKSTMLKAAWEKNLEVRPERDWEQLVGRAVTKKDES